MTELEKLCPIREIGTLKARYFRTMDSKNWPGLESVFAPGLVADFPESTGSSNEAMLIHGARNEQHALNAQFDAALAAKAG